MINCCTAIAQECPFISTGPPSNKTCPDNDVCKCDRTASRMRIKQISGRKPKTTTIARTDPQYYQHLHRLNTIHHVVDDSPPNLPVEIAMKCDNATNDYKRLLSRHEDNKALLKSMNYIQRTAAKIDAYNPKAGIRRSNMHQTHLEIARTDKANELLHSRLQLVEPTIKNKDLEEDWKVVVKDIAARCKYALTIPGLVYSEMDYGLEPSDCRDIYRPKVFLDIAVEDGRTLGRLTILLFSDVVPLTSDNFLQLILNYKRQMVAEQKGSAKKFVHYVGSPIHRVFQNTYALAGDVVQGNGSGGQSALGPDFKQENFKVATKHTGMLAMVPNDMGLVNSNFLITLKPLRVLQGRRVFFGRIIKGLNVLEALKGNTRANGKPKEDFIISNCGVLRFAFDGKGTCKCQHK